MSASGAAGGSGRGGPEGPRSHLAELAPGAGAAWIWCRENGARIFAKPLESVPVGGTVLRKGKEQERRKLAGQAAGTQFWVRSLVPDGAQGRKVTVLPGARNRCVGEQARVPTGAGSPAGLWPGRAELGGAGAISQGAAETVGEGWWQGAFQKGVPVPCSSPLRLGSKALTVGSSHCLSSACGNLNQFSEVLGFHEVPAWGRECEEERQ